MKGFTLIEVLVMVGVFLAVSVVIIGILFSTLRGGAKTTSLDQVKLNGDFAISLMSKSIRNAKSLTNAPGCIGSTPNTVEIVGSDDSAVIFSCEATTISQNGSPILNTGQSGSVELVSGTCNFSCSSSGVTPTITIKFKLTTPGSASFIESKSTVDFETSVTLRN